ncbi:PEP-CTERM sorting domain-containing protein [Roseateles oligotrophus]|uniref:PEP-CTERM sorting domain-containing protein n=1 Tax=Roseateles oligotrophus TaxID=1769250 RepID=A0ABT2YM10_9BURK|nr:PEP-CTERM sorting domain-containing protein [Roseateles oligotrophus]MCV2371102.1 PEP-CTERM sorting domain-containing protein [Roseateles oligotrophus]
MKSFVSLACTMVLTATSMMSSAHAGAVLGFASGNNCSGNQEGTDEIRSCLYGGFIHQNYGDTAGVDVQYQDTTFGWERSLSWWGTGYGGANGVLWSGESDTNSSARIILKAIAGHSISLEGLGLASYLDGVGTWLQVHELDSNVNLMDEAVSVNITTGTQVDFNSLSSSKGWVIEWKNSSYDIGLSQLTFNVADAPSQAVPEPASLALVGLGLAAAAFGRRRQKS